MHPKKIDLSLGRVRRLMAALGDPQDKLPPVIHVAGTNGKGSVIAYLSAFADAAGKTVHVYTSPHLVRFNERIRVAGQEIDDATLLALLARVEAANAGESITFFEITTAAAFLAFAETPADFCLIEVGLGGRFDATNVVAKPACAVVTAVGVDHVEFLTDDIAQIASEKAGVFRPDIAAVVGQQNAVARAALAAEALEIGAALQMWGRDFSAREENGRLVFEDHGQVMDLPTPSLAGGHQIVNAGVAIAAAQAAGLADAAAIARGIQSVAWPGRLHKITAGPLAGLAGDAELWVDGAHNALGAAALAAALADFDDKDPRPIALVVAMQANKDAAGFFDAFAGLARTVVCTALPGSTQGATPHDLAVAARAQGLEAVEADALEDALELAAGRASPDEAAPRVVICGSLYLVGDAIGRADGVRRTPTAG